MTRTLTRTAILGIIFVPAMAWASGAMDADTNGDGKLTIDEMQTAYPGVTAESFSALDANGDGALDVDEIEAAESGGLLDSLKES